MEERTQGLPLPLSEQLPPPHPNIKAIEGMPQEGVQEHPGQHLEFPNEIRDADGKVVVAKPVVSLSKEQIRLLEKEPADSVKRWKGGFLGYWLRRKAE